MAFNIKENLHQNKDAWVDMFHVLRRELYNIFTDRGVLIVFFIACLVYPLVCGYIYNRELLYDIPVAVVDESNSSLSREYLRKIDATSEVKIQSYCSSMEQAKKMQSVSKVHGIIYIPKDFSYNLNRGEQSVVGVYADVTSFFWYRNIMLACSYVSQSMGAEIQVKNLIASGTDYEKAVSSVQPFKPTQHLLYNPGGYPSFILPIVLILVLQQTLLIGIGMLTGKATETNRLNTLIPDNAHYKGVFRIIFGRALALFITYLPIVVYVLIIIPKFFNLPQLVSSPYEILWFITPFLFSTILLGMTIGVFFKNRENSIPFYLFMSIPMLLLSGLSWPREAMPVFWEWFSRVIPSTDAVNGFVRMTTMGSSMSEISKEHLWLWILSGVYFITTFFAYRWRINKGNKEISQEE